MPIVYIHTYIHTYISLFAAAATRTQNESHRQYMETPLRHGVLLHGSSRYRNSRYSKRAVLHLYHSSGDRRLRLHNMVTDLD